MFTFLERFADLVVLRWLGLDVETHLGGALHFFAYDTLQDAGAAARWPFEPNAGCC